MALNGPWGSGKSSVLALVRESLGDSAICVEYQPWLFHSVDQLIRPFFETVFEALVRGGAKDNKLRKTLERFGGLLSAAASIVGADIDVSELAAKSPQHLRDEICEVSRTLGKRIVVLIDDVDRLPVDELAQLLKLVRLCGNFPFFTYLLAYDRRVVSESLRTLYKGDSDFLDKIIQVEVPLPPVPPILISQYACDGVRQLGDALGLDVAPITKLLEVDDDEHRVLMSFMSENDAPHLLLRSLRDAKRFLNALSCTLPLVTYEIDLKDFALMELLRVFFPAFYDELYENRFAFAVYDARETEKRRATRQAYQLELAKRLRELPRGSIALKIACALFPVFDASLHSPQQHYGAKDVWRRRMRASDPASVEKYFQLRVPPGAVPRRLVREAIERFNGHPDAQEAKTSFVAALSDLYAHRSSCHSSMAWSASRYCSAPTEPNHCSMQCPTSLRPFLMFRRRIGSHPASR